MAVNELSQERLSSTSAERVFLVTGEASSSAARTAVLAVAPTSYNSLSMRPKDIQVQEEDTQDSSGNQDYTVTVPYGLGGGQNEDLDVGDTRILFSSAGGSVHITQSLQTIASYGDAEDHEEAIGVDADGNVTGTDILTGGFSFSIVKIVAAGDLDTSYIGDILSLNTPNPKTNNAIFSHTDTDGRAISFATGEVLFISASNSPRGDGNDELRFEFKASKNLTDALPQTGWTIAKKGWEHLWLRYERDVDAVAGRLVTKPFSAFVEKIYEAGDFSLLSL